MTGQLTVLVNAGPWLPVPPHGYGGLENVVATLVPALREAGARVVLATVGESTLAADERIDTFATGRFATLPKPYNTAVGVAHAHMQQVITHLARRDDIDIVHDHLEVVGPAMLAAMGTAAPPALHTLHWDPERHLDFYAGFDGGGRVFVNGVSATQLSRAPERLREQAVGHVPLAVALDPLGPVPPAAHVLCLGRISPLKGQDLAARAARRAGTPLVLAGPVADAVDAAALAPRLADPAEGNADIAYFRDRVAPLVDGTAVRWVGSVAGEAKADLLRTARALLMPVQWEEPGATVVAEAFAAGVPVIGTRRGVLPSLVEHGRTGFLADDEDGLVEALERIDEIDRAECRRVAADRFSPHGMAQRYLDLYAEVLRRSAAPLGEDPLTPRVMPAR